MTKLNELTNYLNSEAATYARILNAPFLSIEIISETEAAIHLEGYKVNVSNVEYHSVYGHVMAAHRDFDRAAAIAEEKLGTFIEAKRDELNLTLLDVKNMTGISVDDQIQIEWNLQYPTEKQLMQYRSMNMLPEEAEAEADYENEALLYAEKYGIIDYKVEESVMSWTETYANEGTFHHTKDFAPEHTCSECGDDVTGGGYLAEWSDEKYCSLRCAERNDLTADDVESGLEDGTFFWTDWSEA